MLIPYNELLPFCLFFMFVVIECILRFGVQAKAQALQRLRRDVLNQARQLRDEARPLESPATFAQAAKLQRKAAAQDKLAEKLRVTQRDCEGGTTAKTIRSVKTAASVVFTVWCWGRPAVVISAPHLLWPMEVISVVAPSRLSGNTGAIGGLAWTLVCTAASGRIVSLLATTIESCR